MKKIAVWSWLSTAFMGWGMTAFAGTYSGGSGTAADPYQIGTVADWTELMAATNDLGKQFRLTADIDFGGTNLVPVGKDYNYPFTGTFDGNGRILRNVSINQSNLQFVGVFGCSMNAVIRNLGLKDVSVVGKNYIG